MGVPGDLGIMVFYQLEMNMILLGKQTNQDGEFINNRLQQFGYTLCIEYRLIRAKGNTEPDLQTLLLGKVANFPKFF